MSNFGHRIKHLIQEMLPPTTFFFIAFQLLALTKALTLKRYGIEVTTFVAATIGALVAAKVVVLADLLPFINRFPGKPLVYNITWKAAIYFLAAFLVRYLEEFIHLSRQDGHVVGVNVEMVHEIIWTRFWAIQIWLMVLLLIYCTLDELVRALGRDRVRELFLGVSNKTPAKPLATTKASP